MSQIIRIKVKPNSKKGPLVENTEEGFFIVYVREKTIDGEANQAVIKLLAKYFNTNQSSIKIVKGERGKDKVIELLRINFPVKP